MFSFSCFDSSASINQLSFTRKELKPQYQTCQDKDIYHLDSKMRNKTSLFETEAKGLCIDCVLQDTKNPRLQALSHSIPQTKQMGRKKQDQARPQDKKPEQVFKEKLKKRVIGLIQSKIAETERLKACMKGDKTWFTQKAPKVDWSLMKAVCEKDKQALAKSIKSGWVDMRESLALTSVNPDQIVTGKPNLSFPLKHEVSSFGSIKKLTKTEKKQVKETWVRYLKKTALTNLTHSQFETAFLKEDGRFLGQNLSTNDLRNLRRNTRQMQKQSQDRYRQIVERMPLLAYLKTGDPNNQKDMDQAFSKMTNELKNSLKKIEDKDVDTGTLLAFKPLVEGLLKESKGGYCLIAERARQRAEKEESLKKVGLLALGVLSAVPCFVAGPVGSLACLGAGLGAGLTGYAVAKAHLKDSLGRALTGKEYERMADLAERDKEKFWELILLPTAGFGTTAGAIKGAKELTKKMGHGRGGAGFSGDSRTLAQQSLNRNLNDKELLAIEKAHLVGLGKKGKDGGLARKGYYTQAQLKEKRNILTQAGFSKAEIRTLMEKGVVGFDLRTLSKEQVQELIDVSDLPPEQVLELNWSHLSREQTRNLDLRLLEKLKTENPSYRQQLINELQVQHLSNDQIRDLPIEDLSMDIMSPIIDHLNQKQLQRIPLDRINVVFQSHNLSLDQLTAKQIKQLDLIRFMGTTNTGDIILNPKKVKQLRTLNLDYIDQSSDNFTSIVQGTDFLDHISGKQIKQLDFNHIPGAESGELLKIKDLYKQLTPEQIQKLNIQEHVRAIRKIQKETNKPIPDTIRERGMMGERVLDEKEKKLYQKIRKEKEKVFMDNLHSINPYSLSQDQIDQLDLQYLSKEQAQTLLKMQLQSPEQRIFNANVSQISSADSLPEAKKHYQRMAQQYHPDKNPDDPSATKKFQQIKAEWDKAQENFKK